MNETTTQPAQAGREKCKPFCGMTYVQLGLGTDRKSPEIDSWRSNSAYPLHGSGYDRPVWCSEMCREARLPHISPPTPAPAIPAVDRLEYQGSDDCITWVKCHANAMCFAHKTHRFWVTTKWVEVSTGCAPATSEPGRRSAKSIETCCTADGCCAEVDAECGKCGMRACWKHAGEDHKCASRPAQEAAKAEPKCAAFPETLHGPCSGEVLERCRYNGRRLLCDGHFLAFEARDFEAMNDAAKPTGLLRDSEVSERLPRHRLTHSAMWADEASDV